MIKKLKLYKNQLLLNATQNYEYYQQILRLESRAAYRFLFIIDLQGGPNEVTPLYIFACNKCMHQ